MKVYIDNEGFEKLKKLKKQDLIFIWRDPLETPHHVLKIKKIKTVHHYSDYKRPSLKNRIKDAWAALKNVLIVLRDGK